MQKKLIALAIAGMATAPAFAQTHVTVYGVADVTLENVRATGATSGEAANKPSRQRVTSNSSLLGFRGTEDLGNGLSAIFQFETGVAADGSSTTGPFSSTRDTFVGLKGGFGTIKLGNNSNPYRRLGAAFDFNPGATGIPFNGAVVGKLAGTTTGLDDRLRNSVAYDSPNFAGFQVQAIYGANENRSNSGVSPQVSDHTYGLGLNFGTGPLYVGYTYERRNDPNVTFAGMSTAGGDSKLVGNRLAAKYQFLGTTTVGLLYDRTKAEGVVGASDEDLRRDAWGIQLEHLLGANQFVVQYTQGRDHKGSLCDGDACDQTAVKMWSVAWNYNLSKRTMLKTYYAQIRNERDVAYDFYTAPLGGLATGSDPRGFGVGFRHLF